MIAAPPAKVKPLSDALLFGADPPVVALYAGAKIRPGSYAPLADAIVRKLSQEFWVSPASDDVADPTDPI